MKVSIALLLFFCGLVCPWPSSTQAALLTTNGGLDSPDFSGDANIGSFTGWSGTADQRDELEDGLIPGSTYIADDDPGNIPNQVIRVNGGGNPAKISFFQDLGHPWAATDLYELSFNASEAWFRTITPSHQESVTVTIRQTSDDTVLWSSGVIDLDGTHGGPASVNQPWTAAQTFGYTIDASTFAAGSAGEDITLYFEGFQNAGGLSSIFYLDNIALELVPEPSSAGLLALAGVGFTRRRRSGS